MELDPKNAVGKPFVVYIEGERHELGSITRAALKDNKLFFEAELYSPEREEGWQ